MAESYTIRRQFVHNPISSEIGLSSRKDNIYNSYLYEIIECGILSILDRETRSYKLNTSLISNLLNQEDELIAKVSNLIMEDIENILSGFEVLPNIEIEHLFSGDHNLRYVMIAEPYYEIVYTPSHSIIHIICLQKNTFHSLKLGLFRNFTPSSFSQKIIANIASYFAIPFETNRLKYGKRAG